MLTHTGFMMSFASMLSSYILPNTNRYNTVRKSKRVILKVQHAFLNYHFVLKKSDNMTDTVVMEKKPGRH